MTILRDNGKNRFFLKIGLLEGHCSLENEAIIFLSWSVVIWAILKKIPKKISSQWFVFPLLYLKYGILLFSDRRGDIVSEVFLEQYMTVLCLEPVLWI